jgi:hypothetical protein
MHDITEILLNVTLNTTTPNPSPPIYTIKKIGGKIENIR